MKRFIYRAVLIVFAVLMAASVANAETKSKDTPAAKPAPKAEVKTFDELMQPILEEYLKIAETFASNKTDDVDKALKRIESHSKNLETAELKGDAAERYKDYPAKIREAVDKVGKAKNLVDMREEFKGFSKLMIEWARMVKPKDIYIAHCSEPPTSWLQKGKEIKNPFRNSKLKKCGEIVSGPEEEKKEEKKDAKK